MLRLLIAFCIILNTSCGQSQRADTHISVISEVADTIPYTSLGNIDNDSIFIEQDINLKGGVCLLPKGMNLCSKGGIISNGTLIGDDTKIIGRGVLFDKVTIKGNWNVPYISTQLFATVDEVNSLRQVVALAHPQVQNTIVIEKDEYQVKAEKEADACISLCSNTNFILNGSIYLVPNDFEMSDIIRATGKNIRISGEGTITGDKKSHTGKKGEWGMGINFKGAINSSVSGLTIQQCWGDCIYVGGSSKDILIEKCALNHGRRQGISVTKADGVTIRDCKITNVKGTSPQCAIDIEPNQNDSVNHILIEKVLVKDCIGGFMVTRHARKEGAKIPWVGNIIIKNCQVHVKKRIPIIVKRCDGFKMEKCQINAPNNRSAISILSTSHAEIIDNTLSVKPNHKNIKNLSGKEKEKENPISISNTKHCINRNNIIIER